MTIELFIILMNVKVRYFNKVKETQSQMMAAPKYNSLVTVKVRQL